MDTHPQPTWLQPNRHLHDGHVTRYYKLRRARRDERDTERLKMNAWEFLAGLVVYGALLYGALKLGLWFLP